MTQENNGKSEASARASDTLDGAPFVASVGKSRISSDPGGFEALSLLHQSLVKLDNVEIHVDMKLVNWLDAHLAAPLLVIIRHAQLRRNIVKLRNLSEPVRTILRKNQLLSTRTPDVHKTTMPVAEFRAHEGVQFSAYAKRHLSRREMPRMSSSLQGRFFEGLDELFANSALHSRTKTPVITAGQFYPTAKRISMSVADGGRGIKGSIREALSLAMSGPEAIARAMQPNNTTRQGDVPGGLGLQIVTEFVKVNNGKLTIVSNDGFWCQDGSLVRKRGLKVPFPGTVVILEVNTGDKRSYDLGSPNPQNIW